MNRGIRILYHILYFIYSIKTFFMYYLIDPLKSLYMHFIDGAIIKVDAFDLDKLEVKHIHYITPIDYVKKALGLGELPKSFDVSKFKGRNFIYEVTCGNETYLMREDNMIDAVHLPKRKGYRSPIMYASISHGIDITEWLKNTRFMTDLAAIDIFKIAFLKGYGTPTQMLKARLLFCEGPRVSIVLDDIFDDDIYMNNDVIKLTTY